MSDVSAHASWIALNDSFIRGIHHALNNRIAAISAVGQVLEAEISGDHPLAGALTRELALLESTTELLRLLVRGSGPEAIQLGDAVDAVVQLYRMHHDLRDLALEVSVSKVLYPLWIDPADLQRALLILLATVARPASRTVRLQANGDEREIVIHIEPSPISGEVGIRDDMHQNTELAGIEVSGAEALLYRWGGRIVVEDPVVRVVLPTLPEARRRENERHGVA